MYCSVIIVTLFDFREHLFKTHSVHVKAHGHRIPPIYRIVATSMANYLYTPCRYVYDLCTKFHMFGSKHSLIITKKRNAHGNNGTAARICYSLQKCYVTFYKYFILQSTKMLCYSLQICYVTVYKFVMLQSKNMIFYSLKNFYVSLQKCYVTVYKNGMLQSTKMLLSLQKYYLNKRCIFLQDMLPHINSGPLNKLSQCRSHLKKSCVRAVIKTMT